MEDGDGRPDSMTQLYIHTNYPYADDYPCRCANCGETLSSSALNCITDAEDRLTPGEETPAGQCPECHGLVYVDREKADASAPGRD